MGKPSSFCIFLFENNKNMNNKIERKRELLLPKVNCFDYRLIGYVLEIMPCQQYLRNLQNI